MTFSHWVAVAMLAALPMAAIAQRAAQASPADVAAASTATAYETVFKSYRATPEEQNSPDKVWRAANEMVGELGGHSGHIEPGNDSEPTPSQAPTSADPTMPMHQGHGAHH